MATPFSLFDNLTKFNEFDPTKPEDFGATELIRFLIKVLAHDAGEATHNSLTFYKIGETTRDFCNEIHDLIKEVEGETDPMNAGTWDKFDQYADAITPLEEFLFSLTDRTGNAPEKFLPDGGSNDVDTMLTSIESWEKHRADLRTILKTLREAKFTDSDVTASKPTSLPALPSASFDDTARDGIPEPLTDEEKHDDLSFLSALCSNIDSEPVLNGSDGTTPRISPIATIKQHATNISGKANLSIPHLLMSECVRSAMIVYGAIYLAKPVTDGDLGNQLLDSARVWDQAEMLLDCVYKELEKATGGDAGVIRVQWKILEDYLKQLKAPLPEIYIQLRKLARTVRRPYYSRALCLVRLCKPLADYFTDATDQNNPHDTTENVGPLKLAIEKAMDAIKDANKKELRLYADVMDGATASSGDLHPKFATAVDEIKTCFMKYNPSGSWPPSNLTTMDKALETDQKLMGLLKAKITKGNDKYASTDPADAATGSKVTVTVKAGSLDQKEYEVAADTKLKAVLWKFASDHSGSRSKLLNNLYFMEGTDVHKLTDPVPAGKTLELKLD